MLLTTDPAFATPRRGWATLTSFALQTAALAVVLAIPMLQPGLLPQLHSAPPLVPLLMPRVVPVVAHTSSGASATTHSAVLTAPRQVPNGIDPRADAATNSVPEEVACVGCVGLPGPSAAVLSSMNMIGAAAPPPPPVVARPPRVSRMMDGFLVQRIQPDYPVIAKRAGIQGAVVIAALISKEGAIENLRVLSGHPMLIPAAMSAVKQWRYRPYILNGDPIEVDTQITVNFLLGGN
jgi:protein TonB